MPKKNGLVLVDKSKQKRYRRQERKRNKVKEKSLKVYGINSAGLMNKLDSFENVFQEVKPSIFCIQETKFERSNQVKTKSSPR